MGERVCSVRGCVSMRRRVARECINVNLIVPFLE